MHEAGATMWTWLALMPPVTHKPWTLLTAGLLTDPEHWSHLIFTLIGFYFLGPDLERRWGTWRFLRFVAISIAAGFGLSLALFPITPAESHVFHPQLMFGPSAALSALAVAWGRENAAAQIRLYFFLPISGRVLVWITLGFCALGVFFPASVTEGVVSPFGGFIAGILLSGAPSPVRALYLRAKLFFIRRRGGGVKIDLDPRPRATRKRGTSVARRRRWARRGSREAPPAEGQALPQLTRELHRGDHSARVGVEACRAIVSRSVIDARTHDRQARA